MGNKISVSMAQLKEFENQGFEQKIPDLIKLAVGEACKGEYVGSGVFSASDPKDGEIKEIPYYTFRGEDGLYRLNGLTILDKGMMTVKVGQMVIVVRKPDVKGRTGRVSSDFSVLAK